MSLADIGQGVQALSEQIGHVGSRAVTIITDVGEDHHSRAFIEQIRNRLSRVDALVNNDGVMQPGPSDGAATDQWRRAIAAAHGGALRLHARPEGGLQAIIDLPAAGRAGPPVHLAAAGGAR